MKKVQTVSRRLLEMLNDQTEHKESRNLWETFCGAGHLQPNTVLDEILKINSHTFRCAEQAGYLLNCFLKCAVLHVHTYS